MRHHCARILCCLALAMLLSATARATDYAIGELRFVGGNLFPQPLHVGSGPLVAGINVTPAHQLDSLVLQAAPGFARSTSGVIGPASTSYRWGIDPNVTGAAGTYMAGAALLPLHGSAKFCLFSPCSTSPLGNVVVP